MPQVESREKGAGGREQGAGEINFVTVPKSRDAIHVSRLDKLNKKLLVNELKFLSECSPHPIARDLNESRIILLMNYCE
jgi:hypothetical protein